MQLAVIAQSVIVFIFLSDCQGLETRRARNKCAFFFIFLSDCQGLETRRARAKCDCFYFSFRLSRA
jgi:hypothetical protein